MGDLDAEEQLLSEWNAGHLSAGVFLNGIGARLNEVLAAFPDPDARFVQLRELLAPYQGIRRFASVGHVLRWARIATNRREDHERLRAMERLAAEEYEDDTVEWDASDAATRRAGPVKVVSFSHSAFAPNSIAAQLKEVTARQAQLLALRLVSGLTFSEIAQRLGSQESQIRSEWRQLNLLLLQPQATSAADSTQADSHIVTFDIASAALLKSLVQHPDLLKTLSWREFEKAIAAVLARLGFEIELRQGTKDGGIDVVAVRRDDPFGPHRYLIQAKHQRNRVGIEPVRELLFLHGYHGATKSCLATTSQFTAGAWRLAHEYPWQLELKDYGKLLEWINVASSQRR